VGRYVQKNGAGRVIDYKALAGDIRTAVRFLDDAIDVNRYPLPAIEAMHKANRKVGLGIMGWADLLIRMGLPYDSQEAFGLAGSFMRFVRDRAREASAELADQRGVFPNFRGSIFDAPGMPRVRNATTTTIAPTGTLSIIADCSSGIEPLFGIAYKRYVMETEFVELNALFFQMLKEHGLYSDALRDEVIRHGSARGVKEIPAALRRLFRTAHEIGYEDHLEMQARFQEYTDNAVSKTINMPHSATKQDVARAYLLAYDKGCKGITVFRYGTRRRGTLVLFADAD
jgi:ribonucleoside-diphosphate reductase alpha chain